MGPLSNRKLAVFVFCSLVSLLSMTEAHATMTLMYDDGIIDAGIVPWSDSEGSEVAVKFTPGFYPAALRSVQFFVTGVSAEAANTLFSIRIYDDDNGSKPGTLLGNGDITGAATRPNEWVSIDLFKQNIVITDGDFFVSMYWLTPAGLSGQHETQVLGLDTTSPIDGRSFVKWGFGGEWKFMSETPGGDRDAMIRAVVYNLGNLQLSDTGIDKCYDNETEIEFPNPNEDYFGQDAQYNGPLQRLKDNGDETITDLNTNLMWQQGDSQNSGGRTWWDACDYCNSLVLPENGGHSDWRLPTLRELISILDYGSSDPAINRNRFPGCKSYPGYWSIDSSFYWGEDMGWLVHFGTGSVSPGYKDRNFLVRCVRGTTIPEPILHDNSDGTITDFSTGLMWQKSHMNWGTWKEALQYCESLNGVAGTFYDDWRLPNVRELQSIVNPGSQSVTYCVPPFICGDEEWTSSTCGEAGSYAWEVVFWDGEVVEQTKNDRLACRCVRGGRCVSYDELDHFDFSDISSPRTVVQEFPVTITAKDKQGQILSTFNEEVAICVDTLSEIRPIRVRFTNGSATFQAKLFHPSLNARLCCHWGGVTSKCDYFDIQSTLPSMCKIKGVVETRYGNKIGEAIVELFRDPNGTAIDSRNTDANGKFKFSDLSPGNYYVQASYDGRKHSKVLVKVGGTSGASRSSFQKLVLRTIFKPVLFLPGVMGSTDNDPIYATLPRCPPDQDELKLVDPLYYVGWRHLEKELLYPDYQYEIYRCPYDWRQTPRNARETYQKYLLPMIDEAKRISGYYDKVDIVAHSTGGLVVRSYIQSADYRNDIDKVALVGVPNKGSLNAYYVWEGGDPIWLDEIVGNVKGLFPYHYSNVANNIYKELYGVPMVRYFLDSDNDGNNVTRGEMLIPTKDAREFFFGYAQVLGQFMPTLDQCLSINGGDPGPIQEYPNDWLQELNTTNPYLYRIKKEGTTEDHVTVRFFRGTGQRTIMRIDAKKPHSNGLYEDGYPESITPTYLGDGTVLEESNCINSTDFDCSEAKEGKHSLLVDTFTNEIVAFLTGSDVSVSSQAGVIHVKSEETPASMLAVAVRGCGIPLVTDPQARKAGFDGADPGFYEDIPGSEIYQNSVGAMLNISEPTEGIYQLSISGACQEQLLITVSYMGEDGTEKQQQELFYSGSPVTLSFQFDRDNTPKIRIQFGIDTPEGLSATTYADSGTTKTELIWSAVADPLLSGYRIYSRESNEPDFSLLATVAAGNTSYRTGHPWGTPLRIYAVSAYNSLGQESPFSNLVSNLTKTVARFSAAPLIGELPLAVSFTDESTGNITTWNWNFGDGQTSTVQNPVHTYAAAGTYSVTLAVSGAESSDTRTQPGYITVGSQAPNVFQFSGSSYGVDENGGPATITVTRSGGRDGSVSVSYATTNGTATAGSDYTATSGTLSWGDGDTASKTFEVSILNDGAVEANETVSLMLSSPTGGATLGAPSAAVLTIVDNDGVSLPFVTTAPVSNVTTTTAKSGGNVGSDGGAVVTARGVCWSTSEHPTTAGPHTSNGTGEGSFVSQLTGLTPGTPYYVCAYAINSQGTSYGTDVSFMTDMAGMRYVHPFGSCGQYQPCHSSIQGAIDAAADGDTILVRHGDYYETIVLDESKSLKLLCGRGDDFGPGTMFSAAYDLLIQRGSLIVERLHLVGE